MSTVIENQVVQTSFDNKEFEKNINASMNSLDEFKEKLDFKDSEKSFKNLEKASESVDFEKLNDAIDGLASHFTVVGRTIFKITDEIADYFKSKIISAVNAVKSVTTDIIDVKAGYKKYDDYTHGVKTILSALSDTETAKLEEQYGKAIDGVESKLGELMAYTDETSYNFVDMVSTIGKFLGAGLQLDDAVADMQGIANWAALAGQDATTASQAMYQMSQALGAGYVKYQDWAQMANMKNMGTTAAKDVFIEAAMAVGTITDKDIAEAKRVIKEQGGNVENWRNWFYESKQLNDQQWLKTEVLEKGLQSFSSVSNEVIALIDEVDVTATQVMRYGKKVKDGAIDLEDAVKALAPPDATIEDLEKLRTTMEKITSAEYDMGFKAFRAAQEAVTFSEAIEATKDAVSTGFMKIIQDLIGNYEEAAELWTDLANNLWDTFAAPLGDIHEYLSEWSKSEITIFDEFGNEVVVTMRKYMWQGLSRVFAGFGSIFSNLFSVLGGDLDTSIGQVVTAGFDKITTALHAFADILDAIAESATINSLSWLLSDIAKLCVSLAKVVKTVISAFLGGTTSTNNLDMSMSSLVDSIDWVVRAADTLVTNFLHSKGFNAALNVVRISVEGLGYALKLVTSTISAVSSVVSVFVSKLSRFSGASADVVENISYVGEAVSDLYTWIGKLFGFDTLSGSEAINSAFVTFGHTVEDVLDTIGEIARELRKIFDDSPNAVEGALNVIGAILAGFAQEVIYLLGDIFGFDADLVIGKIEDSLDTVTDFVEDHIERSGTQFKKLYGDICTDVFEELPDRYDQMMSEFEAGEGPQKAEAVLSFVGDCMRRGVERIIDAVGALFGVDLSSFKSVVLGFMDSFTEQMNKLSPGFEEAWYAVEDIFRSLGDIFKIIGNAVLDVIGKVAGIEDMSSAKFIDILVGLLSKVGSFLGWVISGIGKLAIMAAPYVKALAEFLKGGLTNLWLAIKAFVGKDNSSEALRSLDNLKKVLFDVLVIFLVIKGFMLVKRFTAIAKDIGALTGLLGKKGEESTLELVTKFIRNLSLLFFAIAILANQDIGQVAMAIVAMSVILSIVLKAIKKMLDALVEFAKEAQQSKLNEKALTKQIKAISKVISKISTLMLMIAVSVGILAKVADKYGIDTVTKIMLDMAVLLGVMLVGISLIVNSVSKLDAKSKQLKKARKMITTVMVDTILIALSLGFLIKYLSSIQDNGGDYNATKTALAIMVTGIIALVGASVALAALSSKMDTKSVSKAATNILKLSVSMLAVPASLALLMFAIDQTGIIAEMEKLKLSLKDLAIGAAVLVGVVTLLCMIITPSVAKKMKKVRKTITSFMDDIVHILIKIAELVLTMYVTVGIIASMTQQIEALGLQKMLVTLGKAMILYAALVLFFKVVSYISVDGEAIWNIIKLAAACLLFAVAINILAVALGVLALVGISMDSIKGIVAVFGVLAGIMILSALLGSFETSLKTLSKLALALLEFSVGLFALSLALRVLASTDTDSLMAAALAIAVVLGVLLAFATILSVIPGAEKTLNALTKTILGFAIAIAILVAVIMVLTVIDTIADDLTNALYNLNEKLPELVEAMVTVITTLLVALADSLMNHAEEIGNALYVLLLAIVGIIFTLLSKIFEEGLLPMLEAVGEWLADVWDSITTFFSNLWKKIKDFFVTVGEGIWDVLCRIGEFFETLWARIVNVFTGVWDFFTGIIETIWDAISGAVEWVWDAIVECFTTLWDTITGVFDAVKDFFSGILDDAWQGIKDGVAAVRDWIKNKIETIWNVIKAPFAKAFSLGQDIVYGLWDGINDLVEWVCKKIKGFCSSALGAIKDFFGISSPSKVMKQVGNYLMEGLDIGIGEGEGDVISTVTNVASSVLGGFAPMSNIPVGFDTSSMLGGIPSMEDFSVDNLTVGGIDYSQMTAFDPSSLGLESMYNMSVAPGLSGGALDIPANFQPTIEDAQLEQISDVNTQNTEEIVNALGEVREELSKQAEIISKFSIILDTGTLVGELRDPMDKALGNKSRLATGRGI